MQDSQRTFYCGKVLSPTMTKVRCFERTAYEKAVLFRMIESVSGFESFGRTTNFSFGGCMFEAQDRLEPDTFLELRIPTERGVAVVDTAVVFVNELGGQRFQTGVKFVRLLPSDRYRLQGEMTEPGTWTCRARGIRVGSEQAPTRI